MTEIPFMYTDMSECDVYKWQLDCTMPMIIKDFQAIPEDRLTWVACNPLSGFLDLYLPKNLPKNVFFSRRSALGLKNCFPST